MAAFVTLAGCSAPISGTGAAATTPVTTPAPVTVTVSAAPTYAPRTTPTYLPPPTTPLPAPPPLDSVVPSTRSDGTFVVLGLLTIYETPGGFGGVCAGDGQYAEITAGAPVTMTDSTTGETLATSVLGLGAGSWNSKGCEFALTILDAPSGHSMYRINVSHWQ